jgi:hypothetical protein
MAGISKLAKKMGLSEAEATAQIRARLDEPETLQALGEVFQINMEDEDELTLLLDLITSKITGEDEVFQEKAAELNLIGRMQKMGLLPG